MRNQAALGKRVRRSFVCSLIAVVIFLCGNIWVSRAEYVDPGFVPCNKGFINEPAMCARTATCTTSSWLWGVRVATISTWTFATAACPGTNVYNSAYIRLLANQTGVKSGAESQLYSAAGPTMSYSYQTRTCAGTKTHRSFYFRGCPDSYLADNSSAGEDVQCNERNCPPGFSFSSNRCACISDSNPPPADMPSNCTVPEPDNTCPPGLTLSQGLCCDNHEQEACEENLFWNFTNSNCQDTPSTQLQCDTADWYWNFTNSTCGSSPAIGMCSGGPDWGNYFQTGCYTSGLGIYGGVCNRSGAFIMRCMETGDYDNRYCVCTGCDSCGGSPIVISTNGNRFDMTDVACGVLFDLNANGTRDQVSWTSAGSDEAWLALDRNRNGIIDSGKELFGNFTFQTEPAAGVEKNGFLALAEYDKPENGGNNDAAIDSNDAVFRNLRLWRDANQNGISESAELTSLVDAQIESISLAYRESRRRDRFGNEFRYRAKVYGPKHSDLGRWAYDVFLVGAP